MVSEKATTIYLVDTVYHMLPVELCLHCSLLPGEDKLAFSVFWEMNLQGEIFNTRFGYTVANLMRITKFIVVKTRVITGYCSTDSITSE